ncbi:hypothetical protein FOL47_002189 [Perkinsus chesapeaki]|uniref:Uncharacterized protein n=1 Tax=Perkinsus chesapeaki TaxID=330153 RepID=A0A7J6MFC2_PERCH|nr:hypothetical protein FOL47_002189 [Perkinsus chesapeaki]
MSALRTQDSEIKPPSVVDEAQASSKGRVARFIEEFNFWPLIFIFVGSAILQNLCLDQIRNNGGGGTDTVHLLTFAANALGNLLVGFLPARKSWLKCDWKRAFIPATVDLVSQVLIQFGVVLAGAQIFTILYNSCIVWTVVLAFVFLKARFSIWQLVAITVVIVGVAMKSFVNSVSGSSSLVLGTVLILCGCFMHSLTNIINEYYIKTYDFPPTRLSGFIGLYSIIAYAIYFIAWTSWRVQSQILDEIDSKGSTVPWVAFWYFLFTLANFLHAAGFFLLLGRIGNVGTAITKGLKTGTYVFISHLIYCSANDKYCVFPVDRWQRTLTLLSALLSIAGVIAYGYFTKKYNEKKARQEAAQKECGANLIQNEKTSGAV